MAKDREGDGAGRPGRAARPAEATPDRPSRSRLGEALRENLRRRKTQARARAAADDAPPAGQDPAPEDQAGEKGGG